MQNSNSLHVTITRQSIVSVLQSRLGLSGVLCEEIVEQVLKQIVFLIQRDSKLVLQNFGTFRINHKQARPGRNLYTGQALTITAKNVVNFTPANALKNLVNSSE